MQIISGKITGRVSGSPGYYHLNFTFTFTLSSTGAGKEQPVLSSQAAS